MTFGYFFGDHRQPPPLLRRKITCLGIHSTFTIDLTRANTKAVWELLQFERDPRIIDRLGYTWASVGTSVCAGRTT